MVIVCRKDSDKREVGKLVATLDGKGRKIWCLDVDEKKYIEVKSETGCELPSIKERGYLQFYMDRPNLGEDWEVEEWI